MVNQIPLCRFKWGAVTLLGINPCQRCIVPTRNSLDGNGDRGFQQQFVKARQAQLPYWVNRERFNHFYKLAVNTRLATDTQSLHLQLDDVVQVC